MSETEDRPSQSPVRADAPPATPGSGEPAPASGAVSEEGAPETPALEARPAKKASKKKRSKPKLEDAAALPLRPEQDAGGRDRPKFLLSFPQQPELEELIGYFEAGNYRELRRAAPQLIERSSDEAVRAAARELLRRIEPDPLVKLLLLVAILLFTCLVALAYGSHV